MKTKEVLSRCALLITAFIVVLVITTVKYETCQAVQPVLMTPEQSLNMVAVNYDNTSFNNQGPVISTSKVQTGNPFRQSFNLLASKVFAENLGRIRGMAKTTLSLCNEEVQQAVDIAGRVASSAHQSFDRYLTVTVEKFLVKQQIKRLIGVRSHSQMSFETGKVDVLSMTKACLLLLWTTP
jgi:hypothetical protein